MYSLPNSNMFFEGYDHHDLLLKKVWCLCVCEKGQNIDPIAWAMVGYEKK